MHKFSEKGGNKASYYEVKQNQKLCLYSILNFKILKNLFENKPEISLYDNLHNHFS